MNLKTFVLSKIKGENYVISSTDAYVGVFVCPFLNFLWFLLLLLLFQFKDLLPIEQSGCQWFLCNILLLGCFHSQYRTWVRRSQLQPQRLFHVQVLPTSVRCLGSWLGRWQDSRNFQIVRWLVTVLRQTFEDVHLH